LRDFFKWCTRHLERSRNIFFFLPSVSLWSYEKRTALVVW
jgi:hypothetical protein